MIDTIQKAINDEEITTWSAVLDWKAPPVNCPPSYKAVV